MKSSTHGILMNTDKSCNCIIFECRPNMSFLWGLDATQQSIWVKAGMCSSCVCFPLFYTFICLSLSMPCSFLTITLTHKSCILSSVAGKSFNLHGWNGKGWVGKFILDFFIFTSRSHISLIVLCFVDRYVEPHYSDNVLYTCSIMKQTDHYIRMFLSLWWLFCFYLCSFQLFHISNSEAVRYLETFSSMNPDSR